MAENIIEPHGGEKTFTQAELDAIIGKRLAEERKKFPTEEEIAAYNAYKSAQQTDAEKLANLTTERNEAQTALKGAQAEVEKLKHERFLLGKSVPADDLDYFDFKISAMVTAEKTYEQAAEEFLKTRQPNVRIDMGGSLEGGKGANASSVMNSLIRAAANKKF